MTEQNKTTTIPLPVQGKDMDSIMQSLESGVEELFTSNRYQEFLKTMAKFHKKRRSVIKRLHQKQIAIARRSGKPIPKYLDQEMERKRG